MSQPGRKLAAIMFTDMVGYTVLGQKNESLSLALVEEQRKLVRPIIARHEGKEIKTIGDSFLVEFPSAVDAVRCAYSIQRTVREFNLSLASDKRIHLRIGVHVGEVVESDGDISGDSVNVASRIEPLAEDGGVCLTRQVYDHVSNKIDLTLSSIGQRALKNVFEPVEVYKVLMPWDERSAASNSLSKKRIAILPFTNLSSDPEEGYFADGMTEELITSISGVRQLTVIARTSVMGYKGTSKKVKEIANELEVGSVLEGSVRKAGNKVRITAQLIDATGEGHLWAKNYDRQLEDVFAIQSEIAEMVAGELKIRLVEEEIRVIEKKPTENTEAYTYYLRGRQLARERTEPSLRQALGVFEKAIQLDASFAKAYAGLSECYLLLVNDQYEPYEQMAPRAEIAAKKSLTLDPDLAEAHAALANVFFLEDHAREGLKEAKRAVELNPSLPDAYYIMCDLALVKHEKDAGIMNIETAYRLDPIMPRYVERLGRYYYYLGKEREALDHWERTVQLAPAGTYRNLSEYYLDKGEVEKAKEFHLKAFHLEPTNRWGTWMKGFIAARTGDRDTALGVIKEIESSWVGATNLNDLAFIYYALGDYDSYFTYLDRATEQHLVRFAYVMYSPLFAKGREDPRYEKLLEKLRILNE